MVDHVHDISFSPGLVTRTPSQPLEPGVVGLSRQGPPVSTFIGSSQEAFSSKPLDCQRTVDHQPKASHHHHSSAPAAQLASNTPHPNTFTMSGGYSKFRCKYFLTHDCPNWVFMNGHACAACLAEGREEPEPMQLGINNNFWNRPTEICVPRAFHGNLHYTIMEVVPAVEPGAYWTLRQKALDPQVSVHTMMTTSDIPRPAMVTTGVPMQMRRY